MFDFAAGIPTGNSNLPAAGGMGEPYPVGVVGTVGVGAGASRIRRALARAEPGSSRPPDAAPAEPIPIASPTAMAPAVAANARSALRRVKRRTAGTSWSDMADVVGSSCRGRPAVISGRQASTRVIGSVAG